MSVTLPAIPLFVVAACARRMDGEPSPEEILLGVSGPTSAPRQVENPATSHVCAYVRWNAGQEDTATVAGDYPPREKIAVMAAAAVGELS